MLLPLSRLPAGVLKGNAASGMQWKLLAAKGFLPQAARDLATKPPPSTDTIEPPPHDKQIPLLDPRSLSLDSPTYMVWGANTDVGKTIVSSGLTLAACQRPDPLSVLYVKPVQTGFPTDCDARFVRQNASRALKVASIFDQWKHGQPLPKLVTVSLFQWEPPVSPHVAARDNPVPDADVIGAVRTALRECKTQRASPDSASVSHQLFSVTEVAPAPESSKVKPAFTAGGVETAADQEGGTQSSILGGLETAVNEGGKAVSEVVDTAVQQVKERLRVEMLRKWVTLIETAGGVASPGPSGNLQCDIFRSLRLPGVLVGDGRLGGISATIAAYESLLLRGFDTDAVVLMDHGLGNADAIERYLQGKVPVVSLPRLPTKEEEAAGGPTIDTWLFDNRHTFGRLLDALESAHVARLTRLRSMAGKASDALWWPFTQHGLVGRDDVTVIDSRCGDEFAVYAGALSDNQAEKMQSKHGRSKTGFAEPQLGLTARTSLGDSRADPGSAVSRSQIYDISTPILTGPKTSESASINPSSGTPEAVSAELATPKTADPDSLSPEGLNPESLTPETLNPSFDACASWWTQGVTLEGQLEITRAMAYAAGRYGHVMFPENVHEPALRLAEKLLAGVGKGWADRVYYSDNGSTAIEIAVKMAFRKFVKDHGLSNSKPAPELYVLALNGSYHGDTLGAMEAQASTPYTAPLQQPWYRGRGCFLDPPKVELVRGRWQVRWDVAELDTTEYGTRDEVFSIKRTGTEEQAEAYRRYIGETIREFEEGGGSGERPVRLGGLILEPVIHGAGGMELIDPLFQRTLIQHCKEARIPVILDEVFAGIWRLGRETAAELLGCTPDIACYAKLLTGGMLPLAVTLATEDVFKSFLSDNKLEALLHGHSYTAHATGCAAAVAALDLFTNPSKNPNYDSASHVMKEMWAPDMLEEMSCMPEVTRVVALGTVFALELRSQSVGYGSPVSRGIVLRLRKRGVYSRALGNVLYLMCTPMTKVERCTQLLTMLKEEIERTDMNQ